MQSSSDPRTLDGQAFHNGEDPPASANKSVPTIYIIDDDEGARDSLGLLLECEDYQVLQYKYATEFFEDYSADLTNGCILLDLMLGDTTGNSVHERLNEMGCKLPIIYLTAYGSIPVAVKSMRLGAADFMTKPFNPNTLLEKLRELTNGQHHAYSVPAARLGGPEASNESGWASSLFSVLTPREREIMKRVLTGQNNKLIARDLGISYRTVELHRSHILQKTGKTNMMELAQMAFKLWGRDGMSTETFQLTSNA